jgi:hypothetical protein
MGRFLLDAAHLQRGPSRTFEQRGSSGRGHETGAPVAYLQKGEVSAFTRPQTSWPSVASAANGRINDVGMIAAMAVKPGFCLTSATSCGLMPCTSILG